jgi:type II secretion system (T2SS) protein G
MAAPPAPPQARSRIGYVFGGLAFIPLIGVIFGIVAIVIGAVKADKKPVLLGAGGIVFTVLLYGGLFYYGFVAKTGIYADMKIKLAAQVMANEAGQIALYKLRHGRLPRTLAELPTGPDTPFMRTDAWSNAFAYKPNDDGTFELRSAGPDGTYDTADDIVQKY